jgi:hypothetical protein
LLSREVWTRRITMPKIKEMIDLNTDPETGYEAGFDIDGRMRVAVYEVSEECGRDGLTTALDRMLGYGRKERSDRGRY